MFKGLKRRSGRQGAVKKNSAAKKNRRSATRLRQNTLSLETLENRQMFAVAAFQNGVSSYQGTEDTILYSQRPNTNFAGETSMSPDQQDADGVRQGLLQFTGIFGDDPGQIPLGSNIQEATLTVSVVNSSTAQMQMSLYRMLTPWTQSTATWNSFGEIGGVQASEGEATVLPPDAVLFDPNTGVKSFDVTRSLQNWASGQSNFGWLIESAATDGWDFDTSEASVADRPRLQVTFTPPSGPGQLQFIETEIREAEGDAAKTVSVNVSRVGGVAGTVAAGYVVEAGTAGAGDFFASSGTITFLEGETSKAIDITIQGDVELEGNETISVSLMGASVGAQSQLTLTIADDDALINEVLANITAGIVGQPLYDETNLEYVELVGTPGATLEGYYFVVFEGQEEELAGATDETGSGVADVVIDLATAGQGGTPAAFGANGLLLIRPENFGEAIIEGVPTQLPGFAVDAATNQIVLAGFSLEDNSQTYALVRSSVPIVLGADYDTVGQYVDGTQESVDSPLGEIGVLDVGPFLSGDAQIVDSVFVVQGSSDRDRAAVTADLGLPGVHVHQPTRSEGSERQTSDAVSRRDGNKLPNTIGAWFNGDIEDDNALEDPIAYLNGTTRISVVAPPGSVLTPGRTNTLRNAFISAAAAGFDEAAGIATFTVTRTGDTSQPLNVDFTTVDGLATAGSDYVAQAGTLTFPADGTVAEQSQTITVTLIDDGIAEGFETFSLQLNDADAPFLITQALATATINDANVEVAVFQQGVNGYSGTTTTYIDASQPNFFFGFSDRVVVDDAAGSPDFGGATGADIRPQQGLIKFDDLFGSSVGQVPAGAQIFGGFLTVNVLTESADTANIEFFRMLQEWDAFATWTDPQGSSGSAIINGVTPDARLGGGEAYVAADSRVTLPAEAGSVQIPLNAATLEAWSTGASDNFGWVIVSDSDASWEFSSASAPFLELRPELTLLYTNPSGSGEIGLADAQVFVSEGDAATIAVQRVGGSAGAASVNWALSTLTAQGEDFSGPASGVLNFADGELVKTITVPTIQDNQNEVDETLSLTLIGGNVLAGAQSTLVKIGNNDINPFSPPVLVSEIVYNQPGNDGGAELFELTGSPGAPLGGLYAVVIAGDIGADEGATDLVVDLGTFTNGANGQTLIGARDTFSWNVPDGTTYIGLEELNVEFLGGNDNGTSTYALVYSPLTPLRVGRFDYDFNNDGSLELPAGAEIIDSIAIRDNSSTDSTYGGGANTLQTNPVASYDAVSRLPGTTTRNDAASWFGADLQGGDDALVYDPDFATGLPSVGAAVTPGGINAGVDAANPLATIASIDANGGVEVSFTGVVSQVLVGDATSFTGLIGPGISVTNVDGSEIFGVNAIPDVVGLDSNTLELSFSGSATSDGRLPLGTYRLNFVGNSVVANRRGLDAAGTGAGASNASFTIEVVPSTDDADFDGDNAVSGFDFLAWQRGFGTSGGATVADGDANADQAVGRADFRVWEDQFGTTTTPTFAAARTPGDTEGTLLPADAWFSLAGDGSIADARGRSSSAVRGRLVEQFGEERLPQSFDFSAFREGRQARLRDRLETIAERVSARRAIDQVHDASDEAFEDFDAVFSRI